MTPPNAEQADYLGALNAIIQAMGRAAVDLHTVLLMVTEASAKCAGAESAVLYRYHGGQYHPETSYPDPNGIDIGDLSDVAGLAVAQRQPVQMTGAGETMLLAVPLLNEDHPAGVIVITQGAGAPLTQSRIDMVTILARQAALALASAYARREAEAARQEAEREHATLRAIIQNAPDGLALVDADGTTLMCNDAMAEINGWPAGSLQAGKSMVDAARWHYIFNSDSLGFATADAFAASVVARLSSGKRHLIPAARRANGRWVEAYWYPLPNDQWLIVHRDVTLLKEQEARLARDRDAALAADQAKSTFLATMSHEIRTPLNGVLGMLDVLERQGSAESGQASIKIIRESAGSLLRIIDDVLDLSKIEAGRMELEATPFSLRALIGGLVETMLPRAGEKHLALTADPLAGGPDRVEGDPTRVRQILFNLVGNAIKFTERGFVRITAAALSLPDCVRVTISVTDSGIGLDQATRSRLFAPFSQADSSTTRRFGGTGLGLSIVRHLAQLMGGDVTVDSRPGEGSKFTVELRLAHAAPGTAPTIVGTAEILAAGPGTPRVLIVDDHPINRQVIKRQVELLGLTADAAGSGAEALDLWRDAGHPIILLDLHMPTMDGYTLARTIRRDENHHGLPRTALIAVTADAMPGQEARCLDAGMDACLIKPVVLDTMSKTLARWMPAPVSPTENPGGNVALFDAEILSSLFGAYPDRLRSLKDTFAATAKEEVNSLNAALTGDTLGTHSHRLVGAARMAGAGLLADEAERVERAVRSGDLATARAAVTRLNPLLQATLAAMYSVG